MLRKLFRRGSVAAASLIVSTLCFVSADLAQGQTFNSGSTGADGALNLTTPGTILFDPNALGLHPAVPNVFNFTTINIAPGVTVQLTNEILSGPVYWLAQGPVEIDGTVDLNGQNGWPSGTLATGRLPAFGGAGGYSGGVGGSVGTGVPLPQPGDGPGGGTAQTACCGAPGNGAFTGSQYLIPLIGGSAGGGGIQNTVGFAGGGG